MGAEYKILFTISFVKSVKNSASFLFVAQKNPKQIHAKSQNKSNLKEFKWSEDFCKLLHR